MMKLMKVVLKQTVENVGNAGEVKDVADGFARNFLIPNGLAETATEKNVAAAEKKNKEQSMEKEKELEKVQQLAEKIDGKEVVLKEKAEENKLFGSIDSKKIAQKLKEEKIEIPESSIEIAEPIKELGEHEIKAKLGHGIEASLKIIVEKE